jgi:Zn-dependent protease/predicted transcriptional regulator
MTTQDHRVRDNEALFPVGSLRRADIGFGQLRLGRPFGVELAADWSVLVIMLLVMMNLGAGWLPRLHPDWAPLVTWLTALCAAVTFLASIALHELAHALVARMQGIPVRRITLFLFGGVTEMERDAASPRAEFLVAAVGPLTSLVIGGAMLALASLWTGPTFAEAAASDDPTAVLTAMQGLGPLPTLLLWLGPINVMLAVFNLVPGFPLDGGRVLRALLWATTKDLTKATRWAARAGQVFALVLVGWGLLTMFTGTLVSGLWLVLIGWFLNGSARSSYEHLLVRQALRDVPVRRVMRRHWTAVEPDVTLDRFVHDYVMQIDQQAFPVARDGQLHGVVRLGDVRRVPEAEWTQTTVAHVMTPLDQLHPLSADADAEQALEELARREVEPLPVLDHDQLVGLVSRSDLMRWLALHEGIGARPWQTTPTPARS